MRSIGFNSVSQIPASQVRASDKLPEPPRSILREMCSFRYAICFSGAKKFSRDLSFRGLKTLLTRAAVKAARVFFVCAINLILEKLDYGKSFTHKRGGDKRESGKHFAFD